MTPHSPTNKTRILLPLAALAVVATGWLSLLQTSMTASNDPSPDAAGLVGPLMDDSGEFVVAWHTWGVTHPPAYPFLSLVANILTRVYGLFTPNGVATASMVSFTFGVLALIIMARPIWKLDPRGFATAAAILLPAFGQLTWLYSSVAEAYSMALLLTFGALMLALETGNNPHPNKAMALGLIFGLAVGHHRTLLAMLPALAIAAWPARKLGWRVWAGAAAFAALSLGVYFYLPVVKALGSPWVYGRSPLTLDGFLDALAAREYGGQIIPPTAPTAIAEALVGRIMFLARETSWGGLVIGAFGLGVGLSRAETRRAAATLAAIVGCYLLAPVSQFLLIGTHLLIMVASLALAAAWGLGLAAAPTRRPVLVGSIGLALAGGITATTFYFNRSQVAVYTQDKLGERITEAMKSISEKNPTVVEMWGPRYFTLAYGRLVSKELASIDLVDGRGELSNIPSGAEVMYAVQDVLYLYPPQLWSTKMGTPAFIESAGDGIVAIRREPRLSETPAGGASTDIAVDSAQAWIDPGGDVRVTIEWRCVRPTSVDYRVFVQITDQPGINRAEDIIAQGDRFAPVYGFYPTSGWQRSQLVRDDYRIPLSGGRNPTLAVIGLYTIGADGAFNNYLSASIPIAPYRPPP
ncbi:MAG TPA: DUF2723 domain-containing protein [Anaerolineales bacterium]|nr:DUF2723 domain-containing protein [Anaerolineales bacterium]